MSTFHGPQGKGATKRHREEKRADAEHRQSVVAHERTRMHREGRCALLHELFEAPGGAA